MSSHEIETVDLSTDGSIELACSGCGVKDRYPRGYLTEKAKREYKCSACREVVVERSVQEREIGGRKLLTED